MQLRLRSRHAIKLQQSAPKNALRQKRLAPCRIRVASVVDRSYRLAMMRGSSQIVTRWRVVLACVLGAVLLIRSLGAVVAMEGAAYAVEGQNLAALSIACHEDNQTPAGRGHPGGSHVDCCVYCAASARTLDLPVLAIWVTAILSRNAAETITNPYFEGAARPPAAPRATNAAPRAPPVFS